MIKSKIQQLKTSFLFMSIKNFISLKHFKHFKLFKRQTFALFLLFCMVLTGVSVVPNAKPTIKTEKSLDPNRISQPEEAATTTFISKWDTTITRSGSSDNRQIALPLVVDCLYDFVVTWGDGLEDIIESYDDFDTIHNYENEGIYTITIEGILNGWQFNNGGDCEKLIEISQWGTLRLGNLGSYFYGCSNLNLTATDSPDLAYDIIHMYLATTNLYEAFRGCQNLGASGNMNEWDTSAVTNMASMFFEAGSFNQPIGDWDTSAVTTMQGMFYYACDFNQDISMWDTSAVTLLGEMFVLTSFDQNIGGWNISAVTDMGGMFSMSGLSTSNYDSLLMVWSQLSLQSGVSFTAGWSQYSPGASEAARQFIIDTYEWSISDGGINPSPSVVINSPTGVSYSTSSLDLDITASDANGIDQIWYNWEGVNVTYTEPLSIEFGEGVHTLYAWANDTLGIQGVSTVTFTVDLTSPLITILNPLNETFSSVNQIVEILASDANGIDQIWYNWEGVNVTYTESLSIEFGEGIHTLLVWANDTVGIQGMSTVTFTVDLPTYPPYAPTWITVDQTISPTTLTMEWDAVDLATSYEVYIAGVPNGSTDETNFSLNFHLEGIYPITVRALNLTGTSIDSSVLTINVSIQHHTYQPTPPTDLQITAGDGFVSLTWNSPDDDGGSVISSYHIHRSTSMDGEYSFLVSSPTNSYTDTNVSNGNTYYYKIKAINMDEEGEFSPIVSATPESSSNSISGYIFSPYVGVVGILFLIWWRFHIRKRGTIS
ncbi:MAG: BspA family leucine-rich repeat surface protein [Promethearchaeota archaeon]